MKALLLYGSPRKQGNTAQIVKLIGAHFKNNDIEIDETYLSDLKGSMCIGCDYCKKSNRCIFSDDYTQLINKISSYNIVVLAIPVYFGGVTSQAKILIDRMQILYNFKKNKSSNRVLLCVSTAAERKTSVFDGIKITMKYVLYALGITNIEYILVNNALDIKPIAQLVNQDQLKKHIENIINLYK